MFRKLAGRGGIDARGVRVDQEFFDRIRAEALSGEGVPLLRNGRFERAQFAAGVDFSGFVFEEITDFKAAEFEEDALFERTTFRSVAHLEGIRVGRGFSARDAHFDGAAFLDVEARFVALVGARFAAEATLVVREADIALDLTEITRHSTLWGAPPLEEEAQGRSWRRPRLLSVRRANVAGLELGEIDLRDCLFAGVLGLEALAALETVIFPCAPRGFRRLPLRRWSGRRTVADEHAWRARRRAPAENGEADCDGGADAPDWKPLRDVPGWLADHAVVPEPQRRGPPGISALYRALRKSHEDFNNYPEATDFYYGEMEMRRRGLPRSPERVLLTMYWFLSGYGTRASRAFTAFALLVIVGAGCFAWFGLQRPDGWWSTFATALESTISLLRPPTEHLTTGGRFVAIALKVFGPVLLGLGAFALRARVKR
jgi:hypothetical protein